MEGAPLEEALTLLKKLIRMKCLASENTRLLHCKMLYYIDTGGMYYNTFYGCNYWLIIIS
jgi:hypothetical protein